MTADPRPDTRTTENPEPRTEAGRDLIDAPFTVAGITDFDHDRLLAAIRAIENQAVRTGFGWGMDSAAEAVAGPAPRAEGPADDDYWEAEKRWLDRP